MEADFGLRFLNNHEGMRDVVAKKFNEYSTFHVELFAPYSKKFDCHLLSRVLYPFDVTQELLKRLKNWLRISSSICKYSEVQPDRFY